jgi:biotin transport system substrate-specific component
MRPTALIETALGGERTALKRALAVLALGLLSALSAWVRLPLPFTPVPVTLQTFFALLSGALLGAGGGAASQVVALGVLAASPQLLALAAPGGLLGPTGGYLLAFVPAAWLVGRLAGESASYTRLALAMAAGSALIYLFGALQLALVAGLSARGAIMAGVLPFLPGDAVKLLAAAAIARALRR